MHPPCNICEMKFKTVNEMKIHKNKTHSKAAIEIAIQVTKTNQIKIKEPPIKNSVVQEKEDKLRKVLNIKFHCKHCNNHFPTNKALNEPTLKTHSHYTWPDSGSK